MTILPLGLALGADLAMASVALFFLLLKRYEWRVWLSHVHLLASVE
ncbi:hypothetical protein TCARB_0677 [Thermofilum adornatum 1505]|uniref:Uncharacterized protein n=1 Tax=Thermofilum adornatum 1505 TaxID=697581 RepID=A0A3G1A6G1_9CREN|nr:hypothetical protein TCARB_0677 [Thermofilum adornatum 1505]